MRGFNVIGKVSKGAFLGRYAPIAIGLLLQQLVFFELFAQGSTVEP